MTKQSMFWALAVLVLLGIGAADDTGTLSVVGKDSTGTTQNTVGITLFVATKTWQASEPGNRQYFFKTKMGRYFAVANTVYLCKSQSATDCVSKDLQAGQLMPLNPTQAKQGDTGSGHAEETGNEFSWEIK